jgi:CRP-like cAMP-binding protein
MDESRIRCFILMPEGLVTQAYNIITAAAVIYAGFSLFLYIGFAQYLPPYNVYVFDKVVDSWFWLDMALNFMTAYYKNGKVVTNPGQIFVHYLRGWFLVDLFGTLPFESFSDSTHGSERKFVKLLKFLKIPRLLRLARLRRILQGKGQYVTLVVYLALSVLAIHAAGCLWMLALNPCSHFPPLCSPDALCDWSVMEDIDPLLVATDPLLGPECLPSTMGSLYAMAASHGASMILGFGGIDTNSLDAGHYRSRMDSFLSSENRLLNDTAVLSLSDVVNVAGFPPNSFASSYWTNVWILSAVARLVGFVGVAFLTGLILKLEINAGYRETVFRRHVEAIEAELSGSGAAIPAPLLKRIRDHIAERWHSGDFGKSAIAGTDMFSSQLKGEILAALNKDVLMKVPFFRSASFEAIQLICQSAIEMKFLSGELIFRRGQLADGIYLVRSGTVLLSPFSTSVAHESRTVVRSGRLVTRLGGGRFSRIRRRIGLGRHHTGFPVTKGSWFGEGEVLRELVDADGPAVRREVSAEAKNVVHLIFIPTETLGRLLFENPQILHDLLLAHSRRFVSGDLPGDLRAALRFSPAWEERVADLIDELERGDMAQTASELFRPLDESQSLTERAQSSNERRRPVLRSVRTA